MRKAPPSEDAPLLIGAGSDALSLWSAKRLQNTLNVPGRIKMVSGTPAAATQMIKDMAGSRATTGQILDALRDGAIETAVIPADLLPADRDGQLQIAAYLERLDSSLVLVIHPDAVAAAAPDMLPLKKGARIAARHPFYRVQLGFLGSNAKIIDAPDEPSQRLGMLRRWCDAVLLSAHELSPLNELGAWAKSGYHKHRLAADSVIPLWGSGALAVLAQSDDLITMSVLKLAGHKETYVAVEAERLIARELEADQGTLVGAHCLAAGDSYDLKARLILSGAMSFIDATVNTERPKEAAQKIIAELSSKISQRQNLN